jgi:hypothetical protein
VVVALSVDGQPGGELGGVAGRAEQPQDQHGGAKPAHSPTPMPLAPRPHYDRAEDDERLEDEGSVHSGHDHIPPPGRGSAGTDNTVRRGREEGQPEPAGQELAAN